MFTSIKKIPGIMVISITRIKISININGNCKKTNGKLIRDMVKIVMLFINKRYAPIGQKTRTSS